MNDEFNDAYDEDESDPELPCLTCGGEGFVDNVEEFTTRRFWDHEGPGECPKCGGSGLRKDQKVS